MSDDARKEEAAYLYQVYRELEEAKTTLEHLLSDKKEENLTSLKMMSQDISLNFDSVLDNLDTFSAIEMKNREIDQMNQQMQIADREFQKVKRLLEQAYFGKVVVDFLDQEPEEVFYIGLNSFVNQAGENRIYDWRSPIAELFYNNQLGDSSYVANGNPIKVSIKQRRQFIILKNQLLNFFDTSIAIQDDVLLQALEADSTKQMKEITATIQKEQNLIIRDTRSPSILVNGIAGSGKSSAIMQRTAYLLYSFRKEMNADNILILSPNNRFIDYISNVLPALGEKNPQNLTLLQFITPYLTNKLEDESAYFQRISQQEIDFETKVLRSQEFVNYLKNADQLLLNSINFFKDIKRKGQIVISKETILRIYESTPKYERIIDRIQGTKQRLISYWEQRILKQAESLKVQDQILSLSEDLQKKYFGELIQDDSEERIFYYSKKLLRKRYQKVTKAIEENRWIDSIGLFQTIYQGYQSDLILNLGSKLTLDQGVILVLIQNYFIEKLSLSNMRYILIDEIQDYSQAQMDLLLVLFPQASFTLVGDENQGIFNSQLAFKQIMKIFQAHQLKLTRYDLMNSYRSSGAITKVMGGLVTNHEKIKIVPVRPLGEPVTIKEFHSQEDFFKIVRQELAKIKQEKLTIIVKTIEEADTLLKGLQQQLTDVLTLITIIPISLAKGLEFDHILVYNVSKIFYQTEQDQRILYTAISRGMQTVLLTYEGQPSELLKKFSINAEIIDNNDL